MLFCSRSFRATGNWSCGLSGERIHPASPGCCLRGGVSVLPSTQRSLPHPTGTPGHQVSSSNCHGHPGALLWAPEAVGCFSSLPCASGPERSPWELWWWVPMWDGCLQPWYRDVVLCQKALILF